MAYKKLVQGRSYPFLYNLSMAVGSHHKLVKSENFIGNVYKAEKWGPNCRVSKESEARAVARGHVKPIGKAYATETETVISPEPNKRDDVMLVQYLLKRIYQKGMDCVPPLNPADGAANLTIDGLYGPKTQRAIEHFQFDMKRNGRNIATDGCIDPERGDSTVASISKTHYTISWLNKYFWLLYPALAPNIGIDPECPPELRQAISRCQK